MKPPESPKMIFRLILSVSLSVVLQIIRRPSEDSSSTFLRKLFFSSVFLWAGSRLPVHSIITVFVESKFKRNRPPQKERLRIAGARARRIRFSLFLLCPWKVLVYLLPLHPDQPYIQNLQIESSTRTQSDRERERKSKNKELHMLSCGIYGSEIERKQTPNVVRCCSGAEFEVFLFINMKIWLCIFIQLKRLAAYNETSIVFGFCLVCGTCIFEKYSTPT